MRGAAARYTWVLKPKHTQRKGKPEKFLLQRSSAEAPSRKVQEPQKKLKTLERVLSKAGLGSRTEARSWIHARRVTVNGKIIENPDHWVDLDLDQLQFDGRPLEAERKVYIVLNKPKGYLTTYKDPEGRPTIYDLLRDLRQWVAPVGRLDLDTSGLLLLTNDTDFAEQMTNPDYHVPKTYLVKSATLLSDEQLDRLRQGVTLKDGPTRPAEVRRVRDVATKSFIEMTISEGRNRQVRRMIEAVDSKVLKLVRVSIGSLQLEGLELGNWRELTRAEVSALMSASQRPKAAGKRRVAQDEPTTMEMEGF